MAKERYGTNGIIHIDGIVSGSMPKMSTELKCKCGSEVEPEYGFCGHGLGMFNRCVKCFNVYDFIADSQ